MDAAATVELLGGLGLFLLGIHHLTEGLKSLAGDSMRRALQGLVSGRLSAVVSGAIFTVGIQSSTATILTVIGFVSAGLVTFSQAIGITIGATLGTTSTPWMVAVFGFRIRIADFSLPLLGVGALLWIVASGKWRSLGAILAGFGLLFTGIEYLQEGMAGISWDLEAFAGTGAGARWILAGVGIVMTIVMQSSSAAAATTLVALDAGSLTFEQGCAMVVGQSIGTAATSALAALGGGLAVRRTALAHVVFSMIVGVLGLIFLGPLTAAADRVGEALGNPNGVLALAAFSTLFKLAGVVAFYPWLDAYARFIVRISGSGGESAVGRLDPTVAQAGGSVALEAAWRATLEVAHAAVDAVRGRIAGEPIRAVSSAEGVQQVEQFLESISLDTIDPREMESRMVRLCHALNHLAEVDDDLQHAPLPADGWERPAAFEAGTRALTGWLEATRASNAPPDPAVFEALALASRQVGEARKVGRDRLLEDLALQRVPAATARAGIEALVWADSALHHAYRLAESLRLASGRESRR